MAGAGGQPQGEDRGDGGLVLTQRPVPRKVIEEIVDDIVLPLVRPRQ